MPGGLSPTLLFPMLRTALEGMSAEDFAQLDTDIWRAANRPFSPLGEADPLAHLSFAVTGGDWAPLSAQVAGELGMDRIPVAVLFSYHLRPDQQVEDYDRCFAAAARVCETLNNTEAWALGACEVEVVIKASVGLVPEQPYALVESRFNITFNPGD